MLQGSALDRRLGDNLAQIRQDIAVAAAGRAVELVCVTKYARDDWFEGLLRLKVDAIGESHLPQATLRCQQLRQRGQGTRCHLLGAQQSRKVKAIPDSCDVFQAVDRLKIAALLNAELVSRDAILPVLLEVNADAEPQKHGFLPAEVEATVSGLSTSCPRLRIGGLMAIPQARQPGESGAAWEVRTRTTFGQMRRLFDRIRTHCSDVPDWNTLSMGMSQDYAWAIAEGSTLVRIGSALFVGLEG
jgi:pyridoxal phosphate enzyme (YggS family)